MPRGRAGPGRPAGDQPRLKMKEHMDVIKMSAKLYAATARIEPGDIVAAFHRWIVAQSFAGHTWIDVADYNHVKGGPGVVLVGIEANVSFDQADATWGVVYTRKQPWPGSLDLTGRLRATMHAAAESAAILTADAAFAGRLDFATDRILIRLNDRLTAPNTQQTLDQAKSALTSIGQAIWGTDVTIDHHPAKLSLFEATLRGTHAITLETLQRQLQV